MAEEAPRLLLLFLADRRRAAHTSAASARTFLLCQVHAGQLGARAGVVFLHPGLPCNALPSRSFCAFLRALYTCKHAPCCLLQAFAEEVTNLQKQDAGPEELQQKLVQVGAGVEC